MRTSKFHEFIPKSYLYLIKKRYTFATFKKDLLAGITVGIVALPLGMAFATASGLEPIRGIHTSIVAGFLISLLSGSRIQIGGPTGAFIVVIYDIVQRSGYGGLCAATALASCFLILFGLFRLGSLIKYIPHSLVTGITTGIAFIIFSTQIKDFFGLQMDPSSAEVIDRWTHYFHVFPSFDPITLSLSLGTLGMILCIRRFFPSLPWGFLAVVCGFLVIFIFHLPIETIQSRFGELPHGMPTLKLSRFDIPPGHLKQLVKDGITIAFLCGIESLLSATIGDGMIGGRHRSNCELIAQGVGNFGGILFGGMPATGTVARTATSVKTGAKTPMAGMIHSMFLFAVITLFSSSVSQIPLAALSAILMMVAWDMSELHHFTRLLKGPMGDRIILIVSFLLTVFIEVSVAITVGMILACLLFMKQMSSMSKVTPISSLFKEETPDFPEKKHPLPKKIPKGVQIYEIQGPFFFGTANMLKDILGFAGPLPKVFILRLGSVPMIDASGLNAMKEFYDDCKKRRIKLYLSEVKEHTKHDLKKFGLLDAIGDKRIFPTLKETLASLPKNPL